MKIKQDTRNELFKRQEIKFLIESGKNPTFVDMRKMISDKFSKPEENIDVFNIKGSFGSKHFCVDALVYDTKEQREKMIVKTQKQRVEEAKVLEEEKKKAAEEKKAAEIAA
jgi:ribosomal protein S24E